MEAKDFYTPLESEVHDILNAIETNNMVLKLKGQKLDDNTETFVKQMTFMQFHLTDMAKKRMQDAIAKAEKQNRPQQVVCTHCNKKVMAEKKGTAINNGYECNVFYCADCDDDWIDYIPVDYNDRLKWQLNFITQAEKLSKEKKMDITPAQLLEMKAGYHKMVDIQNDVLKKEAATLQAEEEAQQALLVLKVSIQDIATKMTDHVKQYVANG